MTSKLSVLECIYSVLYELEQQENTDQNKQKRPLTPQEIEQKRQEKIQSAIYKNQTSRQVKGMVAQGALSALGSVAGMAARNIHPGLAVVAGLGMGAGLLANKKINDPNKAQKEDQKAIQKVNDRINKKYYPNQQQG